MFSRLRRGYGTLLPVTGLLLCAPMIADTGPLARIDFHVLTSDGFQIAVREFDLPVPGGSLAEDLAKAGFVAYVMDARGYGGSTRPKAMDQPPDGNRPLSRAYEVVRDITAVVREVQHRNSTNQVALFGWATGALWCGMYTSQYPETVSHLILLNGLYGGSTEHPVLGHGSSSEDPQHPGGFNEKAIGAYSTPLLLHAIRRVCALPTAHWKIAFIRRSATNCTTVPRFWPVC